MKLISSTFKNIGVHRYMHIEYSDGLIALMGPQGSGKSTVVGGIYAGITNDFRRIADTKEEAICQQSNGDPAGLEIRMGFGQKLALVRRDLFPESGNYLEIDGAKALTKDADIKERFTEMLGATKPLLDRYVFVNQWGIRDLFQATPTQRAEAFSHLCGTVFIGPRHDAMNRLKDSDIKLLSVGIEDTDRLRKELAEYEGLFNAENKALSELESQLLNPVKLAELSLIVDEWEEIRQVKASMEGLRVRMSLASERHRQAADSERMLSAKLKQAENTEANSRKQLDRVSAETAEFRLQEVDWKRKRTLQKEFDQKNAEFTLPDLKPMLDGSYEVFQALIDDINREMAPYRTLIDQHKDLPDSDTCPICGSEITDIHGRLQEARDAMIPLETRKKMVLTDMNLWREEQESITRFLDRRESLGDRLLEIGKELADLRDIKEPKPLKVTHYEALAEYTAAENHLKTVRTLHQKEMTLRTQAESDFLAASKALIDAESKAEKSIVTNLDWMSADNDIHKNQEAQLQIIRSQTKIDEYLRVIASRKAAIENAEHMRAQSESTKEWVDLLTRSAPVLHRDQLPREIHIRKMRELEDAINATLESFKSPFRIKTGDDLAYVARFHNGTKISALRLSGGQQVVLSLAMRWALNSLFASQIGLLVLDEPTAGLDEEHLGLLQSTLSQLGSEARNRGCQVIIITHEHRLKGVFDQVIELKRPVL
jgi:exonuclease SbcC